VITPKYVGPRRLIEVAVATLATDRALLLLGVPGTAKTWVSEHLAAAVSGDSTLLVQGTSGTAEEAIRYGWNYARLLAEGPSRAALVPSPVMTAMAEGRIARVEELTRIPSDVQDALITILSEKTLPVPELGTEIQATRGFSVIATANDRDRGVNDLSSALRRRFNTVVLPLPDSEDEEVDIVARRVGQLGRALELPEVPSALDEIRRVVTVFREHDGRRPDHAEVADRDDVACRGDLGGDQRDRAGRALRRRGAPPGRRGRRAGRGRGQGPGHGRHRMGRVPRGRGAGTPRLGRLLPCLP
jgi:MoxR-like ATPase